VTEDSSSYYQDKRSYLEQLYIQNFFGSDEGDLKMIRFVRKCYLNDNFTLPKYKLELEIRDRKKYLLFEDLMNKELQISKYLKSLRQPPTFGEKIRILIRILIIILRNTINL
jgi:hypothetical protein